MNLPVAQPVAVPGSRPVISTYSILLLSGMLLGMVVSGSLPMEVKAWVTAAGTLGLIAYVVTSLAAHKQKQEQQRLATMQVEERLERHSHFDLRSEDLRLDQPMPETKLV